MLEVINPATEELLAQLDEDTKSTVSEKFMRAKNAQTAWAALPLAKRKESISKFAKLLLDKQEELARILTLETGKPISMSRSEIASTPERIEFFINSAQSVLHTEVVQEKDPLEEIQLDPLGVVGIISAWNYPYFVGSNVFIPALLAGNTVLYKPSEFAAMSGQEISKLMLEAGVLEDAFCCLTGNGAVGQLILDQSIDAVFFTGSHATGRKIALRAAEKLIPLGLELGGKDALYLCEDVDVGIAAKAAADGAFYNTGQSCCAVERIYVHQDIAEEFIQEFLTSVKGFSVGNPLEEDTYIGPLARKAQLEVLEQQISDALKHGAKLLCGGGKIDGPGYFFEPSVLTEVNDKMKLMREESFGPVIGIQKVKDDAHALSLMDDSEYGLTAGVFSKDQLRARKILSALDTGSAYINCCDRVSPKLPWSGRRHSGIGYTLSKDGIRSFLQPKAWHIR